MRWGWAGYKSSNPSVCQINKSILGIVVFPAPAEKITAILLVHRRQERPTGNKGEESW